MTDRPAQLFGTYVHVPFCATRCDYCDFATWTDRAHLIGDYVDACVADLARRAPSPPSTSVFFGGGTPSLLPADDLVRILDAIDRAPGAEVTVECNPDSVDAAKLAAYAAAGVNRVSLGVQSMRAHVLAALGRTHDAANVARAVGWARDAGIERVNVDLIYGTPGERVSDWEATLDGALALEPSHVSAYALTVEPGTPLGRGVAAGERSAPDDDDQATKYEIADDRLRDAGFEWYEISNWARPSEECRHNLLYWQGGEYAAIGCAGHGHTVDGDGRSRRWWNVRTPERYVAAVRSGASAEAGAEELDRTAAEAEQLVLALRMRTGIKLDAENADSPEMHRCIDSLTAMGLVERHGTTASLTRRGRLLGNEVAAQVLTAHERAVREQVVQRGTVAAAAGVATAEPSGTR
ncbi:MAG TPA: radical SAM family heme chaperone HemW [Acidimicrobiia bacterium]|nr:radical SAM family heme chaperone HemW [Acidimicrobiia bacterium]